MIIKDKEIFQAKSERNYLTIIVCIIIFLSITILAFLRLRKRHTKSIKTHKEEQSLLNKKFDDLQVDKLSEDVLKEISSLVKTNDPAFYAKFKEHHPIFIYKLTQHSPDILSSDLDLCAKLKLGFNTKEIAYFSRTSQRAVESRKYRIRKKIGLTTDDDLATWIVNL
ncbi:helix-turn-helix transcriptional regulator [Pedobacter sp.]|uniref:helix-turn-helix transcriptional regulator n=1 Tax=Pedobacter sp. TaxID=1411316 RepID=UPI003BAAF79E